MSAELTTDQNTLIREIGRREGISDYKVNVNSASVKGDGYMGTISTVDLISSRKKLNLILKTAEPDEEFRKKIVIRKAYLREIFVYNKIFPAFENFQRKCNLENTFSAFAKIYGSCDEDRKEFLILENLKEKGYRMWNRKVPMNSDHVALVFSEYGKLHAVSLAMSDKDPEKFKELTADLGNIFENSFSEEALDYAIKSVVDKGFKAVKDDKDATEAMRRYSETVKDFFMKEMKFSEDSIVINHGDCWCNNMMFKYEDNRNPYKPTKLCLIDWQLSKIGSPVSDLAYFFFVCTSKEELYNYKKYLSIYHEVVSENLRNMSCDPDKIFPYSLLERHWKKYAKYGLYMALTVLTLMLNEVEETPAFMDLVKSGDNVFDGLCREGIHINDYNQRILDIVTFMSLHKLI